MGRCAEACLDFNKIIKASTIGARRGAPAEHAQESRIPMCARHRPGTQLSRYLVISRDLGVLQPLAVSSAAVKRASSRGESGGGRPDPPSPSAGQATGFYL